MKYFWFSGNFILAHRLRFVQLIKELRRNELDTSAIRFIDRATFYLIPFPPFVKRFAVTFVLTCIKVRVNVS